jgi:hypothetical protein
MVTIVRISDNRLETSLVTIEPSGAAHDQRPL